MIMNQGDLSVSTFSTADYRSWEHPIPDTYARIQFPRSFPMPPRVIYGIRHLDVSNQDNLRVYAEVGNIQSDSAVFHAKYWGNSRLHGMTIDSLNIAPSCFDILSGVHIRDVWAHREVPSNAPATVRITFHRPFPTPPKVALFVNHLDFGCGKNVRLRTFATEITEAGFTLTVDKWCDTILWRVYVSWIAYPADMKKIFSTTVNTLDVRSKTIDFGDVGFTKSPQVFMALRGIDVDHRWNLRVRAWVENISPVGLTWNIETWDTTMLHSADYTIIAVE